MQINDTDYDDSYENFIVSHESQLKNLEIPQNKWKTLHRKLSSTIFNAGENFVFCEEEDDSPEDELRTCNWKVFTKISMEPDNEDHIYLIDHAWTYTLSTAKKVLKENGGLLERMCDIMNVPHNTDDDTQLQVIVKEMWKYNNSYIIQNTDKVQSFTRCWFIMDEFGSRINYSESPTFAVVPFFFMGDQLTYSLLFPIVSLSEGEEVTQTYPRFRSTLSEEMKKAVKYPWEPCDMSGIEFKQTEPDRHYFMSGRRMEELPVDLQTLPNLANEKRIRIYTEYPEIAEHLTDARFYFTDDKRKAHILWLAERLYDYRSLSESRDELFYVNQFPSEQVLVNKDLLPIVCRRAADTRSENHPKWLPLTYSLMSELPQFISYFQNRQKKNLDNLWIVKPSNLTRGMDIHVTDNLNQIIRLSEVGPMVACKYITDPLLFPKGEGSVHVKFDLRFIVLLKSTPELEIYVYDRFWIRFANKPFSLDELEDYEKHFTVMNYVDSPLQQMYCHDFVSKFEEFHSPHKWKEIEASIDCMIREMFLASRMKDPPAGIGLYPGSRAMYGLDVMLEWDRTDPKDPKVNPVLLEVNWMPDCKRACEYYPSYYDDVFGVLFLNETAEGRHCRKL